jgi:hypothetical protein
MCVWVGVYVCVLYVVTFQPKCVNTGNILRNGRIDALDTIQSVNTTINQIFFSEHREDFVRCFSESSLDLHM